jgi:hypothetical protein
MSEPPVARRGPRDSEDHRAKKRRPIIRENVQLQSERRRHRDGPLVARDEDFRGRALGRRHSRK